MRPLIAAAWPRIQPHRISPPVRAPIGRSRRFFSGPWADGNRPRSTWRGPLDSPSVPPFSTSVDSRFQATKPTCVFSEIEQDHSEYGALPSAPEREPRETIVLVIQPRRIIKQAMQAPVTAKRPINEPCFQCQCPPIHASSSHQAIRSNVRLMPQDGRISGPTCRPLLPLRESSGRGV